MGNSEIDFGAIIRIVAYIAVATALAGATISVFSQRAVIEQMEFDKQAQSRLLARLMGLGAVVGLAVGLMVVLVNTLVMVRLQ